MFTTDQVTIQFEEFNNEFREEILKRMREYTFCIIKGATNKKDLLSSIEKVKESFSLSDDRPTRGEKPSDIQNNFQKLLCGGVTNRYNNFPRFFRTIYNPLWSEDIYGLRENFKAMARVRNLLLEKDLEFALDKVEDDGLWTASRIHQYPTGGGFFVEHRDTTVMDVAEEKRIGFYQLILVMSEIGKDFDEGGAFIEKDGERINLEKFLEVGDIAIYDGTTVHGVEDIDPHKSLVLDKISGRLAGFVSLYKQM